MIDINDELDDQIDRIKRMNKTASETEQTSNNVMN